MSRDSVRHPVRALMFGALLLALAAASASAQPVGGTPILTEPQRPEGHVWHPRAWEPGLYWIVESPRFRREPGWPGQPVREVLDGRYLTRFEVEGEEPGPRPAGVRHVRLRITWIVDGQFDFAQQRQFFRILVNPTTLRVRLIEQWALVDGEERLVSDALGSPPNESRPLSWPFSRGTLPDSLHFVWPSFRGAPGGLLLMDVPPDPVTGSYQTVTTLEDGSAEIVIAYRGSSVIAGGHDPDVRLLFADGMPWYQVALIEDGSQELVNPIVEVGQAP